MLEIKVRHELHVRTDSGGRECASVCVRECVCVSVCELGGIWRRPASCNRTTDSVKHTIYFIYSPVFGQEFTKNTRH